MLARLLLCHQFLLTSFLFFVGGIPCFYGLVHGKFDYGGYGCVVVAADVVASFDLGWWLVVKDWGGFNSCEETLFKHLLSAKYYWLEGIPLVSAHQ